MPARLFLFTVFFQAVIASPPVAAQTQCPPVCGLDSLQRRALHNAPELDIAEADIEDDEARRSRARFAFLDLGSARIEASPTAMRRGDLVHNAQGDISFAEDVGLWTRIRAEIALAITPWWRIVEYWRAARQAVSMAERERDRGAIALSDRVERSFIAAQVARASVRTLRRAERVVDQALLTVERLLDDDIGRVVESDRLRLEITRSSLDARRIEAVYKARRALVRLRSLAGIDRATPLRLPGLDEISTELEPLSWLLEAARRSRPEVPLSLAAVSAARAIVQARRAEFVPELAVGAFYRFRDTPVVDNQSNPFVQDPWNGVGLGYGLVYRWRLDFGVRVARLQRARADVAYARAMRRYALGGIAYEVERAYTDLQEALTVHDARLRSRERAAQRLEAVLRDHQSGEADAETLTDAVMDWLNQEISLLRSTGRVSRNRGRLRTATGRREIAELDHE